LKLLHFSDLHLDAQFGWASPVAARTRRENLRTSLLRIVDLARAEGVDAVLSGGDLYEHERITPDTAEFLRSAFARLDPIPVYLAPGNHDWFGPASAYERVDWTPNVHVFTTDRLTPIELTEGVTLWGAAHRAPANTDDFLAGFRADRPGINLGLFHAAEKGGLAFQETGKAPHAAFDAWEIEASGLDHAFLGHFHSPRDAPRHTYPGNPDPLTFGEDGERGAVIALVEPDGSVERRHVNVATSRVHDLAVDVTGAASRQEIKDAVALALVGVEGTVRLTLSGEIGSDVELSPADLEPLLVGLDGAVVRLGAVRPAYDLERLGAEPTVRGQFIRDVRSAELDPELARRVLVTGLRALDGRNDLEVG
jgi:exonuclease SbcD